MSIKFTYNGRFMWHGTMITEGNVVPFATFADDVITAAQWAQETLPKDAVILSLERGPDMGDEEQEVENPALERVLEEHRKKQIN